EDIVQDLYLHLRAEDGRRLRIFAGSDEATFRAYLRAVGIRFALNQARKQWCLLRREAEAAESAARPPQNGPSEPQIVAALAELESLLPPADRNKLRWLLEQKTHPEAGAAQEPPAETISSRTHRRWRRDLLNRLDRHLGGQPVPLRAAS